MFLLRSAILFSALIQFLLFLWLVSNKKYKTLAERFFVIFILSGGLYCFFMFLFMIEPKIDFALLKLNIAIFFSSIYVLFAILFSSALINNKIGYKAMITISITIGFVIYLWNNIVKTIEFGKWGWFPITNPVPTIMQLLFLITGVSITCMHLSSVEKTLGKSKALSLKRRISYFRYSMLSLCVLSAITVLFNFLKSEQNIPVTFPAFFFIPSLIMAYALIKKN